MAITKKAQLKRIVKYAMKKKAAEDDYGYWKDLMTGGGLVGGGYGGYKAGDKLVKSIMPMSGDNAIRKQLKFVDSARQRLPMSSVKSPLDSKSFASAGSQLKGMLNTRLANKNILRKLLRGGGAVAGGAVLSSLIYELLNK